MAAHGVRATTRSKPTRDFAVVVIMLLVLATAVTIALSSIHTHSPLIDLQAVPNISRFGYTLSLALFGLPTLVIAIWFACSRQYAIEQKAFVPAVLIGFGFGVLLDVVFGNAFFTFNNRAANLGLLLPGYAPGRGVVTNIPVEEFLFYALGFTTILLIYIWGNVYWFGKYCADNLRERADLIPRMIQPHWPSGLTAILLLTIGYTYRYCGPPRHNQGFPGYFTVLVVLGALPSLLTFPTVKQFVNWRAFSFTLMTLLFISLLWEVTLGVPYAWWGYQDQSMIGLFIEAWAHLPVEAVLVWVAACYGTVLTYELIRLVQYSDSRVREALFGGKWTR